MRGIPAFAKKLITKALTTGSERDSDNEERIVLSKFVIVAAVDDVWLFLLDPFNRQTTFESKAVFPIRGIDNQVANDQVVKIEGGTNPGITNRVNFIDDSYTETFLGRNKLWLDYSGANGEFREVSAESSGDRCYFYMFDDADPASAYHLLIENGTISINKELGNGFSQTAFSANLSGYVNTLTAYSVNSIQVVGEQQPAIADPEPNVVDDTISSLPIGATYNQAEVQALRDQVEVLRDTLESTRAQLVLALDAMRAHGLITA